MLTTLTSPGEDASTSDTDAPADPVHDAVRLAARHQLHVPIQRRIQENLGMTTAELADAVANWPEGSSS
ncbi:hypothetical protein ACWD48_36450 [Streptomyces sp. NPDC002519]